MEGGNQTEMLKAEAGSDLVPLGITGDVSVRVSYSSLL